MNLPSRWKKREVMPWCLKLLPSKRPATVCGVAGAIARAWCEACQSRPCSAWQVRHWALSTKAAGGSAGTIAAAEDAVAGVPCSGSAGVRVCSHAATPASTSRPVKTTSSRRRQRAAGLPDNGAGAEAGAGSCPPASTSPAGGLSGGWRRGGFFLAKESVSTSVSGRQCGHGLTADHLTGANTVFQSSFMLTTVQPRAPASFRPRSSLPTCDFRS